jgi:DNA-binding CsgD family transcriptional regulator
VSTGNNNATVGAACRPCDPVRSGLGPLVERQDEVAALARCLSDARDGAGRALLVEAPAGGGKSRLLAHAEAMADGCDMHALRANGSELERDFPFGVAIQLFEPVWRTADDGERHVLTQGHAQLASRLLDGTLPQPAPASDLRYPLIHGLFWFATNLAGTPSGPGDRPLAIIVDDIQSADRASLTFLAYLAARLADLPIALIMAVRTGESDTAALAALQNAPALSVLRLAPISDAGVEALVRIEFPHADPAFIAACSTVAAGNPFLITELLSQIRADGRPPDAATAARLSDIAPSAVVDSVVARLGSMSDACRELATTVAILGDGTPLLDATGLSGLEPAEASEAADALATLQLLHPGEPLSYVHPAIRSAVLASIPPLARARAHRRAAAMLRDQGAPAEVVAGHLLLAPTERDPAVIETLRTAARDSLTTGEPETAVRHLERALAEPPPPDVYPELLADLGKAEALAGVPHAPVRLEKAIDAIGEPLRRAELASAQGRALMAQGRHADASAAFDEGLRELRDEEHPLRDELGAAFISAASRVPWLVDEALGRRREMLEHAGAELNAEQREALAHTVIHDSLRGAERAEIRRLVELAWSDGALLDDGSGDESSFSALTTALLITDELELALQRCDAARFRQSPPAGPILSQCRAWALYGRGEIDEALVSARAALDAPDDAPNQVVGTHGALACCFIARGQLDRAERVLAIVGRDAVAGELRHPVLLDVRAQLRLAQHRPQEALADALLAGSVLESEFSVASPGVAAWRSTAARAHLALGQAAEARELGTEELEHAKRAGITRAIIRSLRLLGLADRGAAGIELLEEAARFAEVYPMRLETMHALVDLGAALRRAKKRAAARTPLRRALELSRQTGAAAIGRCAEVELASTGVRSRRTHLTGVDALTPSERRVAELASQGMTTRQIAETLFVTPKTIEFHLRHIYRKLDVNSRSRLADVLTAEKAA